MRWIAINVRDCDVPSSSHPLTPVTITVFYSAPTPLARLIRARRNLRPTRASGARKSRASPIAIVLPTYIGTVQVRTEWDGASGR